MRNSHGVPIMVIMAEQRRRAQQSVPALARARNPEEKSLEVSRHHKAASHNARIRPNRCSRSPRGSTSSRRARQHCRRRGVATLDYVLLIGIVFPLAAFVLVVAPQIMLRVYEMVCAMVSWPFM